MSIQLELHQTCFQIPLDFSTKQNKTKNRFFVQVNFCQKLLFLHQLTHNMTTDCSLNYKFNTGKFQPQTWGECSPHVLRKEELLTKPGFGVPCFVLLKLFFFLGIFYQNLTLIYRNNFSFLGQAVFTLEDKFFHSLHNSI